MAGIVLKCKKCPKIKGDTYCDFHKKQIWKEDDMCEQGYVERIERGVALCIKISKDDPADAYDRIKKIEDQMELLENECNKKFGGKKDEPIKEPVPEPDCPF